MATNSTRGLRQTDLWASIPAEVWRQDWVVDCRPVGSGRTALKYLAPYVFRVALSNNRILAMADGQVTFRYQDGDTCQTRTCTLPAERCIDRFLQHILPKGFVKVRSYGLFRVGARQQLARLRAQLVRQQRKVELLPAGEATPELGPRLGPVCPSCGHALRLERRLPPQRAPPAQESIAYETASLASSSGSPVMRACFGLPASGSCAHRLWQEPTSAALPVPIGPPTNGF